MRGAGGVGAMLVNAAVEAEPTASWFDPQFWKARGAVVATMGGRGGATVFENDGVRYLLRHYHRGGLAARVSDDRYWWLGETRARSVRELNLLLRLQAAQLPVPMPIAARYEKAGWGYRADLITGYISNTETLAQRLAADAVSLTVWTAVGRCIKRFHDYGLCHVDLNAHNILIRSDGEVFLVDFDRCERRPAGQWRDANLARLRRSLDALEDTRSERRFDEAQWHCLLAAYF
jgi:3-deoxy-D-manno-octulosonic acid kinase